PAVRAAARSLARWVAPTILGEGFGLRRKILEYEVHELRSRGGAERRIETTLEADRGTGLTAQTFTARRAPEMGGEDFEVIGQRHDLAVQAVVKLFCEHRFRASANEVWATDPA